MSSTERNKGAACECGCGLPAPLARQTDTGRGYIKGQPVRFRQGHGGHDKLRKDPTTLYKVEARDYETPCWIWQGGTSSNGYGRTKWRGRMRPAHHVFLTMAGVEIPEGMQPHHLCFIPLCVNPEHLQIVTPRENQRLRQHMTLSAPDVREIRAARDQALRAAPLTQAGKPRQRVLGGLALRTELAERYGTTADYIKEIWRGDKWAA